MTDHSTELMSSRSTASYAWIDEFNHARHATRTHFCLVSTLRVNLRHYAVFATATSHASVNGALAAIVHAGDSPGALVEELGTTDSS